MTALIESISRGEVSQLNSFIANGASPDLGLDQDQSLLQTAVYHHNVKATELLLQHNAICWDKLEYSNLNVLASAAFNGYPDIVEMLLAHGVPVDAHWCFSTTALHESCMLRCGHDCPAWDMPEKFRSENEIERFLGTARILIEAGADVNAVSRDWPGPDVNFTPLHFAVEAECMKLVTLLVSRGANTALRSLDGYTPIDLAKEMNAVENASFLEGQSNIS